MSAGYCTVVYDGKGQPEAIAKLFRLKGVEFGTGAEVEVGDELAGLLVKTAPEGSVKVLKGTPAPVNPMSNLAKAAVRAAAEKIRQFPSDPADVLATLSPLPPEILQGVTGKAAEAFIDGGKADRFLGPVTIFAQLGGNAEVAKAAARRAQALVKKAAKPS